MTLVVIGYGCFMTSWASSTESFNPFSCWHHKLGVL